ncbi:MAG: hypothetical protein A2261_00455 [Candidatus Magasanikbacteria bacterium RIFOXYA2_FULL_44_8]|uniref:TrbC/VIRB2 family protein n=1 Tax=Candidatus Magasanikbacteria bacterium RIFOXYA2_FULL_44_8 TaxID=1798696 RepID=A0A1F6NL08_9BACT|nr:MAG: hypothetical protein A2261_00455 [Candidatus Magasanikbacteria bacterium RIFOXYA2_FULL_44_8]
MVFPTRGGEYMKKIIATLAVLSMLLGGMVVAQSAYAATDTLPIDVNTLGLTYGAKTGLGTKDVRETVAAIIKTAMGLLGIVAVVIILIGGFTWMTAGGNDEKIGEAKKWIFAGVIGLAIILSAYALTSFVITQLVSATVE